MIFTARQLQEKCQKQNMDLTKASATVSREGLRKIMAKVCSPAVRSNDPAIPR